ncbi:DUF6252 family protein [Flavobacterium sp.]|uniref:DUF6252 family protein n=1 Tax=Flavobacterium sp. TaxID=239 RepID=UPI0025E6238B|nr:DUF6252 family protein [Flavobacterium sp.]
MKKIQLIAGIFLILNAFISCTTEPIDSAINLADFNSTSNGPAVFKADFSGNTWIATEATATVASNLISIQAAKADGSTFAILIQGNAAATYPSNTNIIAYTGAGSTFAYWSVNSANASENTGSITITNINSVNKTISGTFSYKGYWSDTTSTSIIPVQFTNGVFTNIPYTGTTPPPTSSDNFYAKVDGTEFVEDQINGALLTNVSGMPDQISVVGSKTNGDSVGLNIVRSLAVGTYQFTGPLGVEVNGSCVLNSVFYNAESGSITITSKTPTRIAGTFNMVVKNFTTSATKTVTEGSFDVQYN